MQCMMWLLLSHSSVVENGRYVSLSACVCLCSPVFFVKVPPPQQMRENFGLSVCSILLIHLQVFDPRQELHTYMSESE